MGDNKRGSPGRPELLLPRALSSRCFGVSWYAPNKTWKGLLTAGGRVVHVGYFASEREAAAAVVARQRVEGLDPGRRQASDFCGVAWYKPSRKWCVSIRIGGKARHLGSFETGHPGEVDAALAFDATVQALGSAGRTTKASERTNFEVPGQGARGLSREQAADVEAGLERHLRRVLLACNRTGAPKVWGRRSSGSCPGR